jgi:hypothetical protein
MCNADPSWLQREVRSFARADKIHETLHWGRDGTGRQACVDHDVLQAFGFPWMPRWVPTSNAISSESRAVPTHERLGPNDRENLQD